MSSVGFQSVSGGDLSGASPLGLGVPYVEFEPFAPWSESLGFEFSPGYGLL